MAALQQPQQQQQQQPLWDSSLQQLLRAGTLDGFALVSHAGGECLAGFGTLGGDPGAHPALQQLHALFHSGLEPGHLDVCGQRALVVQRSDSSVYAVSRGKQLGLTAHYLPSGVLVTCFSKPNLPQTVAPQVEAICERLRQAGP